MGTGLIMTKAILVALIALGLFSAVAPAAYATGGQPRCTKNCK
jgi:hypothetical protein